MDEFQNFLHQRVCDLSLSSEIRDNRWRSSHVITRGSYFVLLRSHILTWISTLTGRLRAA